MNLPPPVTRYLLIALVVLFLVQQVSGDLMLIHFALWPWGTFPVGDGSGLTVGFQPWQLVTYGFLHDPGNPMHLLFNGIALWQFGSRVEYALGARKYAIYYAVCLVGAGLCQLLVTTALSSSGSAPFPTIGASGAVFGLLLAYAVMFPRDQMIIIPIPRPMSARTVVMIFGGLELFFGLTGTMQGIAHFAHLGGMLFGWLLLRYWGKKPPFARRRPPGPRLVR